MDTTTLPHKITLDFSAGKFATATLTLSYGSDTHVLTVANYRAIAPDESGRMTVIDLPRPEPIQEEPQPNELSPLVS